MKEVDGLLAEAMALHRAGHLDDAEPRYRAVLAKAPESADAWHFFGLLLAQRNEPEKAIEAMRRSLVAAPAVAGWHSNLGNVLRMAERIDEAAAAYERSLAIAPEPAAYSNLGSLRRKQGRDDDAARCFARALALAPGFTPAKKNLADLEAERGHLVAAAALFRSMLEDDPDDAEARHRLAAVSGEHVPARAADAYVGALFDRMAGDFDVKLAGLGYQAPAHVQACVEALCTASTAAPGARLDVLDAGCGTGLCASFLRPHARSLVGVDLSAGMLEKARARAVYDALVQAELTAYLAAHRAAFDLVVSADTLCYFGHLEEVLAGASGALRGGGALVFTVEALDDANEPAGLRLNATGRYAHGRGYLERALRAVGFAAPSLAERVLRRERGGDVLGFVVAATRPA